MRYLMLSALHQGDRAWALVHHESQFNGALGLGLFGAHRGPL